MLDGSRFDDRFVSAFRIGCRKINPLFRISLTVKNYMIRIDLNQCAISSGGTFSNFIIRITLSPEFDHIVNNPLPPFGIFSLSLFESRF